MDSIRLKTKELQSKMHLTQTRTQDLGTDHYFFIGGGRGLPFLGVADKFFPKSNAFQTILTIFRNVTGFSIDLI